MVDQDKKNEPDSAKSTTNTKNKGGWRQGNKQNQGPQSKYQTTKSGAFKGEITDLNGNVYEVHRGHRIIRKPDYEMRQ
jgi:hypothetical protein